MSYGSVESLNCTPGTHIILYVNENLNKNLKRKKLPPQGQANLEDTRVGCDPFRNKGKERTNLLPSPFNLRHPPVSPWKELIHLSGALIFATVTQEKPPNHLV